ncbi:hypothetical protein MG290_07790 [Flavobacterium sp. CBA20B-1]|uniref:hypothetical protein n=1 Tax=unclassified Flavobacterium TaxID=196869 RepID=UPI00222529D4|nr:MULTISPECIES: hypothetical protein [unclassified Flavobacterium]WCM40878.1 hypothetical protein MG290_07790 [Flavobacterium sp. CBA20B-1]
MKKILMLCTIAFTVACSSDSAESVNELTQTNEVTTNQTMSVTSEDEPTIDDDIDQMFYDYVNSQEFFNAENAHISFFSKLNYTGNYNNIKKVSTLILWVENNLATTNFVTVSEAEAELTSLISLEKIKEDKFSALFNFIKTAPLKDVIFRFNKWIYPNNLVTTNNQKCHDILKNCMDSVSAQYQLEIRENYSATDCSEDEIKVSNLAAKQAYQDGMNRCQDDWAVCMNPKR